MHKQSMILRVLALALPLSFAAASAVQAATPHKAQHAAAKKPASSVIVPPGSTSSS
jgi:hypothetical protein